MSKGWVGLDIEHLPELLPGAHAIVVADDYSVGIGARKLGLELRDTLLVLSPKGSRFAFLLRKPCSEGTVAENVLLHGTGALNIDRCRVSTTESLSGGAYSGDYREKTTEWQNADRSGGKGSGFRQGVGEYEPPTGRWPSNLVFVHGEGCRQTGVRKITAITGTLNGSWRKGHQYSGGWSGADEADLGRPVGYGDADGMETVAAWACVPACPVAELDMQSGVSRSASGTQTYVRAETSGWRERGGSFISGRQWEAEGYGDSGGASRFFPQFESEAALHVWLGRLIGIHT